MAFNRSLKFSAILGTVRYHMLIVWNGNVMVRLEVSSKCLKIRRLCNGFLNIREVC